MRFRVELKSLVLAALAGLAWLSAAAEAAVVCPPQPSNLAVTFTVDPAVSCYAWGNGNSLNGPGDEAVKAGYVVLDEDLVTDTTADPLRVTGFGTNSGGWSFVAPTGYNEFLIGFQDGLERNDKPDYAVFALGGVTPGTTLSGTWLILPDGNGSGELSRVLLYGKYVAPMTAAPVPLPAPALLLLSGLFGVGAIARRARTAAR